MPLYEYECDACGHRFERIQKFSDPVADTCPKCGGSVRKLIASPAFHLKGSGWYITDYAKKGTGEPKTGDTKDGGKDDGKEGAKDAAKDGAKEAAKDKAGEGADKADKKSEKKDSSSSSSDSSSSSSGSASSSTTKPSTST